MVGTLVAGSLLVLVPLQWEALGTMVAGGHLVLVLLQWAVSGMLVAGDHLVLVLLEGTLSGIILCVCLYAVCPWQDVCAVHFSLDGHSGGSGAAC